MTDIILDQGPEGDWIRAEGTVVQVAGAAVMLGDAIDPNEPSSWRRALVRTNSDGLSINYKKDFPNGLALQGVRLVTGHVPDLPLDLATVGTGVTTPALTIQGQVWFEMFPSTELDAEGEPVNHELVSLQSVIQELRDGIGGFRIGGFQNLDPRGAALEGVRLITGYNSPDGGLDPALAMTGLTTPALTIQGQVWFEMFPATEVSLDGKPVDHEVVSLQSTIQELRDGIAALQAQVAELTARLR